MKALTRHITAELIKVFCLVLFGLTLLIMLAVVIQEAIRQGLGLGPILRMAPFVLPDSLRFAVPGATLLVATTVYGRMSAFNEIVAVKSLGISPIHVITPVLWFGALLSLACVWLNDVAVSWGRDGVRRVVVESVEEIIYRTLETQRSYSSGSMAINVQGVEGRMLIKPILTIKRKSKNGTITVIAERAELSANTDEGTLTIRFYDAVLDAGNGNRVAWPGVYEYVVDLSDFSRRGNETTTPSNLPLAAIPENIAKTQRRIEKNGQRYAVLATQQLITGDFVGLASPEWTRYRKSLQASRRRLNRLRTEPHRRWANGLSCFCFALVGSAMSIRRRNGEFLTSFFLCFLPVLVIYYPLLALGIDRAKSGAMRPEIVWLGNLVLLIWGAWLARNILRH